jgi:hypothetical protein
MEYVSLGFSCQTRFSIDLFAADHRRNPFDFNISTKDAVLRGLATSGANFEHREPGIDIYRMTEERRRGVSCNGVYFWHDYPMDGKELASSWETNIEGVNEKYRFLWKRFASRISKHSDPVTFIVSNTQMNLGEFSTSTDDFDKKFGFDEAFYYELAQRLGVGNRNGRSITFLSRDLSNVVSLRKELSSNEGFVIRFGGLMNLATNPLVAFSTLVNTAPERKDALGCLVGNYSGGARIELSGDITATVYRSGPQGEIPWAEVSMLSDGYLFVFQGRNKVFTAVMQEGSLHFSNRTTWTKV